MERMAHTFNGPDDILFPAIEHGNKVFKGRAMTDKQFYKLLRVYAQRAGMAAVQIANLTAHSLRAGGATDFLIGGMSVAWVKQQGGWESPAYLTYYRPQPEHAFATARSIIAAGTMEPPEKRAWTKGSCRSKDGEVCSQQRSLFSEQSSTTGAWF